MHRLLSMIVLGVVALAVVHPSAQSRRERKAAVAEESAKVKSVAGGIKFQVQKPYDAAYDTILNFLKRADYNIDTANKEVGQLVTAMTIAGGYSQTGTRVQVTLIKDTDAATTVKVAVTEQKRKKLLQTEPWSDPKVNDKESEKMADQIKAALQ